MSFRARHASTLLLSGALLGVAACGDDPEPYVMGPIDVGLAADSGTGLDLGSADLGPTDASLDAGAVDVGSVDAGAADVGGTDAGTSSGLVLEIEPNDSISAPQTITVTGTATTTIYAMTSTAGDADMFSVSLSGTSTSAATLYARTYATAGMPRARCFQSHDTVMRVWTSTGALMGRNDDALLERTFCSALQVPMVPGTTYIVDVGPLVRTVTPFNYYLDIHVR